jgi:hypothetical protein
MLVLTAGLFVLGLSWIAAWGHFGILTELSFFPLWLGYILTVNGMAQVLFGRSLLQSMGKLFALLFAMSVPLWWFFEGMNTIVQNWHYHLAHPISAAHYFLQASVDFSTVVPAILSTSFLFVTAAHKMGLTWPIWRPNVTESRLAAAVLLGIGCYSLLPLYPNETFPLVWIAPILILEPLAFAIRYPSLLSDVQKNGWTMTLSIMAATMMTGFWWEMWNYYSLPKWTYTIPYVGFWKVFEMPFLGYFGYPFFGMVVFSYAAIMLVLLKDRNIFEFFQPDADEG